MTKLEYGIYPNRECLSNFLNRIFDQDKYINEETFRKIIIPQDKEYQKLNDRKKIK